MKNVIVTCLALILLSYSATAQQASLQTEKVVYKKIDTLKLTIEVIYPPDFDNSSTYHGMVFYFGGGWFTGNTDHFRPQAEYFARRGLVCFLVDYRVHDRHNTTPFESVKDAKSAMRYVRAHAKDFHIQPDRIIASGGSAGGHLAACTAIIEGFNDETDSLAISPKPNALVLFNPVLDNGPAGYGYERIADAYKEFSPFHNLKRGAPPTVIFLGTQDHLIPVETMEYYAKAMEKIDSRCDLHLYEGQGHGFFNDNHPEYFKETLRTADQFLVSLGYLQKDPVVEIK